MKYLLLLFAISTITCAQAEDLFATQFKILSQSTNMWDGTTMPHYPEGQPEVTIIKVVIPPGAKLPWHKHPSINAGYLVSGVLNVHSEAGKELQLKAGDTLIELVDKWHYGYNPGTEPAEIVVFYAGTPGTPLSIKREADGKSTIHGH